MQTVTCHYDGQPVQVFIMSDRELKVMSAESGAARWQLFERLKRSRPDLQAHEPAKFDFVIQLGAL